MAKIDDGGPAFPVIPPCDESGRSVSGYPYPDQGMTLRDWFAGQALLGCMLRCAASEKADGETVEGMFSRRAYEVADAMLKERNK